MCSAEILTNNPPAFAEHGAVLGAESSCDLNLAATDGVDPRLRDRNGMKRHPGAEVVFKPAREAGIAVHPGGAAKHVIHDGHDGSTVRVPRWPLRTRTEPSLGHDLSIGSPAVAAKREPGVGLKRHKHEPPLVHGAALRHFFPARLWAEFRCGVSWCHAAELRRDRGTNRHPPAHRFR